MFVRITQVLDEPFKKKKNYLKLNGNYWKNKNTNETQEKHHEIKTYVGVDFS